MEFKYLLLFYVQIYLVKDVLSQFNTIGKSCGCFNMPVTFDVPINSIRLPNGVPLANSGLNLPNGGLTLANNGLSMASSAVTLANNGLSFANPSLLANSGFGLPNNKMPVRNRCACSKSNLQVPNLRMNNDVIRNLPFNNGLANAVSITNVPFVNNVPVGAIPVARNLPIANNGLPVVNKLQLTNLPLNNGLQFNNLPNNFPLTGNVQVNCQNGLVGNVANLANPVVNSRQALSNNGRVTVPLVSMNSLVNLPTLNGMPIVKITENVYKVGPSACQNSVTSPIIL